MKIVLANCIGIDRNGWYIIPYASRWTTSARSYSDAFTYYPRDLAYLSSLLKCQTDHNITFIDGCFQRYDMNVYLEALLHHQPDWLVMESSSRTFLDDIWIAKNLKQRCGTKIIMTGQHPTAFPGEVANESDLVIEGDFILPVLRYFQDGNLNPTRKIISYSSSNLIDVNTLPFPEDTDISRYDYAEKGDPICQYKEIQFYASRGCPFQCQYCVASNCYFGKPVWQKRNIENIISEMGYLYQKYPKLEGLFFDDEIHNADIRFNKKLARAIIDAGFQNYHYNAMCAYHTFDTESLELMKSAGYYLLRIGIETASSSVAEKLNLGKKHNPEKLGIMLETAKKTGLLVYGTFMIGCPDSTHNDDLKTIELMHQLISTGLLFDCQISICTPQPGTPLYYDVLKHNLLDNHDWYAYDGGTDVVVSSPNYPAEEILKMREKALISYDTARKTNACDSFEKNLRMSSKKLKETPEKILIFRSSRSWHLELSLEGIKNTYPSANIFMFCHSHLIKDYKHKFPWLSFIPYPQTGFINQEYIDSELQQK
ncbi:MAG: hypothetical protein A2161_11440, partial [Candidatus Schekmanbacteria bacterium RBG_13_48_7]